jgi:uncharacterized protein YegP (UPF0339 family)
MVYVIYRDSAQEYRWRLFADNNKIVADSGEGYKNKADCQHGIHLTQSSSNASIRDQS